MQAVQAPGERAAFRAFTGASILLCVVALLAGLAVAATQQVSLLPASVDLLAIPLTAFVVFPLARFPLVMSGLRAEVVILLDTSVYVVVVHLVTPSMAMLCVAAGMAVACWTLPMNGWVRVAHFGAATALWAGLITLKSHLAVGSGYSSLALTTLGLGMLAEIGTLVIVAITARLARDRNAWALFRASAATEALVGLAEGALAYLTIIIFWDAPAALPMLIVPLLMLMIISRSLVRAQLTNIRSSVLSDAVLHIQRCADDEAIYDAVLDHAARMLRSRAAQYSVRDAQPGELIADIVHPRDVQRRLVVRRRMTGEAFNREDEQALRALAATASTALHTLDFLAAMRWRALHDSLTGLANRAHFFELASVALEELEPDELVAVLFVDLDGFKKVNDVLGHEAGDRLLQEAARRMSAAVSAPHMVARLGGDEFCVLLRGVRNRAEVEAVVAALHQQVATSRPIEGHDVTLAASIGVAIAPFDGTTLSTLVSVADKRMYANKHTAAASA